MCVRLTPPAIMVRFLLVGALCLLATVLSPACSDNSDSQPPEQTLSRLPSIYMPRYPGMQKDDIKLSFELSDQGRRVTVYRAARTKAADELYVQSVAEKFGVTGDPQKDPDGGYAVQSELGTVSVRAEHQFTFSAAAKQGGLGQVLGEGELRQATETYLSERGLLPPDARFLWIDSIQPATPNVHFENVLVSPGLEGPFIIVGFDESGAVARVSYSWPDLEPLGDYPLLSEKDAFDRIFHEAGAWPMLTQTPVEITSVELFFHGVDGQDGAKVFVPVYWFRGPDDQKILVPALRDEYILPQSSNPTSAE